MTDKNRQQDRAIYICTGYHTHLHVHTTPGEITRKAETPGELTKGPNETKGLTNYDRTQEPENAT